MNPFEELRIDIDRAERNAAGRRRQLDTDLGAGAAPEASISELLSVVHGTGVRVPRPPVLPLARAVVGAMSVFRRALVHQARVRWAMRP